MRIPNAKCSLCQKDFYLRPRNKELSISGKNFCSQKCFRETISPTKICICGISFRGKKRKYCSRACANKNRFGLKYDGSQLDNKVSLIKKLKEVIITIRGNKCERCDYNKTKILQVHHKLERKHGGTNELDNLELLCPNCHAEHHYGE